MLYAYAIRLDVMENLRNFTKYFGNSTRLGYIGHAPVAAASEDQAYIRGRALRPDAVTAARKHGGGGVLCAGSWWPRRSAAAGRRKTSLHWRPCRTSLRTQI